MVCCMDPGKSKPFNYDFLFHSNHRLSLIELLGAQFKIIKWTLSFPSEIFGV